jgi:hypothetical protein
MADMNYDVDKLPLGKLSKRTIEQGYGQLKVSVKRWARGWTTEDIEIGSSIYKSFQCVL